MLTSLMPEGLAVFLECVVIGVCIIPDVCSACHYPDLHGAQNMRLFPMPPRSDACRKMGIAPSAVRRYQDVDQGNHRPEVLRPFLYNLAPFMVIIASFLTFACLPVSKGLEVLDFNVGVFFPFAASSIGVVGIPFAGWSSNNKFSLIGAMRSGAQIISYELVRTEHPDDGSPDGYDVSSPKS